VTCIRSSRAARRCARTGPRRSRADVAFRAEDAGLLRPGPAAAAADRAGWLVPQYDADGNLDGGGRPCGAGRLRVIIRSSAAGLGGSTLHGRSRKVSFQWDRPLPGTAISRAILTAFCVSLIGIGLARLPIRRSCRPSSAHTGSSPRRPPLRGRRSWRAIPLLRCWAAVLGARACGGDAGGHDAPGDSRLLRLRLFGELRLFQDPREENSGHEDPFLMRSPVRSCGSAANRAGRAHPSEPRLRQPGPICLR
jgi:hypothetical protein